MSGQCTGQTEPQTRKTQRPSVLGREEPSTHRMSADEVRAFISQFEPEPPPQVAFGLDDTGDTRGCSEPLLEREPPTLLYRGRGRAASRGAAREPGTLLGLGAEAWHEPASHSAGGARERAQGPRRSVQDVPRAHSRATPQREPLADGLWTPSVASPPRGRHGAAPRRGCAAQRVRLWRGRARWAAGALVLLLLGAPLAMFALRGDAAANSAAAAIDPHAPGANPHLAAAAVVTLPADGATQKRMDDARRATMLMMAGDSAGALAAFRVLARSWPEHPALPRVVRLLEAELRACAAEGGAACR